MIHSRCAKDVIIPNCTKDYNSQPPERFRTREQAEINYPINNSNVVMHDLPAVKNESVATSGSFTPPFIVPLDKTEDVLMIDREKNISI